MHGNFDATDKGLGSMFINLRNEFLWSQKSTMRPTGTLYTEIPVYYSKDMNAYTSSSVEYNRRLQVRACFRNAALRNTQFLTAKTPG